MLHEQSLRHEKLLLHGSLRFAPLDRVVATANISSSLIAAQLPFVPKIDPYPLKFLYNMSQMMLCAYMTVEAGLVAYRSEYTIVPCQEFDIVNPAVGKVLYIFYLSKGESRRSCS